MGALQQSPLLESIQVSPYRYHGDIQLLAQRLHRDAPGLLKAGQNGGKPDLLLILRDTPSGL